MKPKTLQQSLEDLTQGLEQLKLNLKSAQSDKDQQRIKDISRSITFTEIIIKRLKYGSPK